jgi:hypothetical protein
VFSSSESELQSNLNHFIYYNNLIYFFYFKFTPSDFTCEVYNKETRLRGCVYMHI